MRFKVPFTGFHVGPTCVDGSAYDAGELAHAHTKGVKPTGIICARTKGDLIDYLRHEIAHLASNRTYHDDRWRRDLRALGGRVSPAYKKRSRPKPKI